MEPAATGACCKGPGYATPLVSGVNNSFMDGQARLSSAAAMLRANHPQ